MNITHGKIVSPQKVVIYGPEGIGKSTLASMFPKPVFVDTEGSTKKLDVARTDRPSSFSMLIEQLKYFKMNRTEYQTLVLDTADWAEILCINEICSKHQQNGIEGFGWGKGYTYLAEEFGRLLNLLEDLIEVGMNVVLNAHATMRKFDQPDEMGSYDRWELKLQKKTAPLVKEWADMVLFANYKTYVVNVDGQGADKGKNKVQGGHRVMYTSHHPCWDAKNRDGLPPEIPMDYNEIRHCIEPGMIAGVTNPAASVTSNPPEVTNTQQNVTESPVNVTPPPTPDPVTAGVFQPVTAEERKKVDEIFNNDPPAESTLDTEGAPKALADMMITNSVTGVEIRGAVSKRGYYTFDTPIANYDPGFIDGCLVGAWELIFDFINKMRRGEA
jgi:GTPase SAR1 family protein